MAALLARDRNGHCRARGRSGNANPAEGPGTQDLARDHSGSLLDCRSACSRNKVWSGRGAARIATRRETTRSARKSGGTRVAGSNVNCHRNLGKINCHPIHVAHATVLLWEPAGYPLILLGDEAISARSAATDPRRPKNAWMASIIWFKIRITREVLNPNTKGKIKNIACVVSPALLSGEGE
jgi:hypothetical protein